MTYAEASRLSGVPITTLRRRVCQGSTLEQAMQMPAKGRTKDISGLRSGRLVAKSPAGHDGKNVLWLCQCDCGQEHVAPTWYITTGALRSCGCLPRNRTHGMYSSPEYRSWRSLRSRCNNPSDPSYARYGGDGISVCARWDRFEAFYADMGPRPRGTSIDRIDPWGNYEPANCRWATPKQQAQNKRRHRRPKA